MDQHETQETPVLPQLHDLRRATQFVADRAEALDRDIKMMVHSMKWKLQKLDQEEQDAEDRHRAAIQRIRADRAETENMIAHFQGEVPESNVVAIHQSQPKQGRMMLLKRMIGR